MVMLIPRALIFYVAARADESVARILASSVVVWGTALFDGVKEGEITVKSKRNSMRSHGGYRTHHSSTVLIEVRLFPLPRRGEPSIFPPRRGHLVANYSQMIARHLVNL